jgi:hypothetical protein
LRKQLEATLEKPTTKHYPEEQKSKEAEELEDQLQTWDERKSKELRRWNLDEQKLTGLLFKSTDERYHPNMLKCTSAFEIWKRLKKDSNQEEAGNLMALLSQLFNIKFLPGEKLADFAARVQTIASKITDLGKEPNWNEIVNFRILSALPNQYDAIQQTIFQLPWKDITTDLLLTKFNAEDSRQEANKQSNDEAKQAANKPSNKSTYNHEEALATTTDRKCRRERCTNILPNHFRSDQSLCSSCYRKKKQRRRENDTNSSEEEKPKKKEKSKKEQANTILVL